MVLQANYHDRRERSKSAQSRGNWLITTVSRDKHHLQNGLFVTDCNMDFAIPKRGRDYLPDGSKLKLLFLQGPNKAAILLLDIIRWTMLVLKPLYGETTRTRWNCFLHVALTIPNLK
jgi:hypothetical protein